VLCAHGHDVFRVCEDRWGVVWRGRGHGEMIEAGGRSGAGASGGESVLVSF
jgi:hypothetical protein